MAHTPASYHAPALHYRAKGICSCKSSYNKPLRLFFHTLSLPSLSLSRPSLALPRSSLTGHIHIVLAIRLIVVTKL